MTKKWLFSRSVDLLFLFLPIWVIWGWAFLSPRNDQNLPMWGWVVFILIIDVGHVWGTLYRSYFNKTDYASHRRILNRLPLICFPLLFGLAYYSSTLFWGTLAYIAIYHFMKQQYGFLSLYGMVGKLGKSHTWFWDKVVIYIGMLFPVFYWHVDQSRTFNWFVENEFIPIHLVIKEDWFNWSLLTVIYFGVFLAWFINELIQLKNSGGNALVGRWLWMFSTYINWYLGIVYFNSDYVFSITNVVAHGVPYLLLIMFYRKREGAMKGIPIRWGWVATSTLLVIMLFAFLEEYLWDALVNFEKGEVFQSFLPYFERFEPSKLWLATFTALLALPQVIHYFVDGVIWKANSSNPNLKKVILDE